MNFTIFMIFYLAFIILSIVIHELGHLFFGLLTGYRFGSFRLGPFVWFKEDGKIKLTKSKSVVAGQCLMEPPTGERFPFVLYNLGGGLLNLITALPFLVVLISAIPDDTLRGICIAGITANIVMVIVNLVPMSSGVPNDGMNVMMALRSEDAKRGFFLMLFVNSEAAEGKRFKDFDDEIFSIKESANLKNYFVAYIVMLEAARLYDMGEYDESVKQCERLNLKKLPAFYRNSVNAEFLYYYTVHNPDFKKARKFYKKRGMRSFLKLRIPQVTRLLSAYEYFVRNNKEKGMLLLERAKNEIEAYPNSGYRTMEREYLQALEEMY